ncbi:MAG: glycosyltransferase family 2 protein [Chloroflexota bacterium]
MRCPTFAELPAPPLGKTGWPWTEEPFQLPDRMPSGIPWPRISIVTASYNRAEFIEETIRSILLQGYPDLEYIIIDGASTDGTLDVIKKYEPWLAYWESKKDRGQSHALNKGLAKCTGDIITYFSSDDFYLPGTFEDVGNHWPRLERYGALVGGFYFIDINSIPTSKAIPSRLPVEGPLDLTLLPPGSWRLHQEATFFTRYALDDVGRCVREDLHYNADRELLFRICRHHKIMLSRRTYSGFRWGEQSGTASNQARFPAILEYSLLYRSYCKKGERGYRQRKYNANFLVAKAYTAYAKYSDNTIRSITALIRALLYQPSYVLRHGYLIEWLKVLRMRSVVERLRGLMKANTADTFANLE